MLSEKRGWYRRVAKQTSLELEGAIILNVPKQVTMGSSCLLTDLCSRDRLERAAERPARCRPWLALEAFDGVNAGRVTPVAFVVHAVAEQEAVCHFQAGEVAFHIGKRFAIMLLVDQGGGDDFGRTFFFAVVDNRRQGMTFTQNVVNNQNTAVLGAVLGFALPAQLASAGCLAVGGGVHVVHLGREVQAWQQSSGNYQAGVQHAMKQGVAVLELSMELGRNPVDCRFHVTVGAEAICFIEDLLNVENILVH